MATVPPPLEPADVALLTELLGIDTQTPMETAAAGDLPGAQQRLATAAARLGFRERYWQPPDAEVLDRPDTPVPVRWRADEMGRRAFLDAQPNAVLQLGPDRSAAQTLAFNCHLDTVAGLPPVRRTGDAVTGRGSVDAKGQAVAVLAGVRAALRTDAGLPDRVRVLLQAVGGEEGGAMGCYGTRVVAEAGYTGRLNVVAEPTRLGALDRTTASMTARVEVDGEGAADDVATTGHNATVALAVIADQLARQLSPAVAAAGGGMCIAGMHTGHAHNRVYGTGWLLLNIAYDDPAVGELEGRLTERCFADAVQRLHDEYRHLPVAGRVARDAHQVCRLRWLKAGLPVLNNRDPAMEALLARAGVSRWDAAGSVRPFTCDAMWLQAAGRYTVVLGAGDLAANGAHADTEHVALADLGAFADAVRRLVLAFDVHCRDAPC
jgi:acetylornithine deacetylase/succinyl-diaminopimelate desuccinylase-like protein